MLFIRLTKMVHIKIENLTLNFLSFYYKVSQLLNQHFYTCIVIHLFYLYKTDGIQLPRKITVSTTFPLGYFIPCPSLSTEFIQLHNLGIQQAADIPLLYYK